MNEALDEIRDEQLRLDLAKRALESSRNSEETAVAIEALIDVKLGQMERRLNQLDRQDIYDYVERRIARERLPLSKELHVATKENPGKYDCYEKALPDEPMFVLLGRDPTAPSRVIDWANERMKEIREGKRPYSDQAQVEEALSCAVSMIRWRRANDGKWRM